MRWLSFVVAAVWTAGCAQGITPPDPTRTVPVEDRDGVVDYLFGGVPPCQPIEQSQFDAAPFSCEEGCPCVQCEKCCKPCEDTLSCPSVAGCKGGQELDKEACPLADGICKQGERCTKRDACLQRDNLSPPMRVQIPAFEIDEHEVTNIQYRFCVEMGICRAQPYDTLGQAILDDYAGASKYDDYPALVLNFEDAKTYCEFVGKRLPTEFEWERVAGGPTLTDAAAGTHDLAKKRLYPFLAPNEPIKACKSKDVALKPCSGAFSTAPVGTSVDDRVEEPAGSGQFVYDLGGNMAEWTASDLSTNIITCKGLERFSQCEATSAEGCDACVDLGVLDDPADDPVPVCQTAGTGETSCWYAPLAGAAAGNQGCYSICATQLGSTAVCEPRWRPANGAINPSTDLADVDTTPSHRIIRGGSYGIAPGDICTARSGARGTEAVEGLESHPWLGVRCACTRGECP